MLNQLYDWLPVIGFVGLLIGIIKVVELMGNILLAIGGKI